MRRFGLLLVVLVGFVTCMVPVRGVSAAAEARSATPRLNAQMQRIVDLVNLRRKEAGLGAVTVNTTLISCAQQYSAVQAGQGAISHTGPDGSNPGQRLTRCGYNWRSYGENLAAGYVDADEVMAAWMQSPSHRKNILSPRLKEIGLGYTHRADDPSQYYDYYVMELGTRK